MTERIVVALDGSPLSERILPQLRMLTGRMDAELRLVRAVVTPPLEYIPPSAEETLLEAARKDLSRIAERLATEGCQAIPVARSGAAAGVILNLAREWQATMIAMTTHGETGNPGLLLGSVAETVIRRSSVPILLVRPFWSDAFKQDGIEGSLDSRTPTIVVPLDGSDLASALVPWVSDLAGRLQSRVVLLGVIPPGERTDPALESAESLDSFWMNLREQGLEIVSIRLRGDPIQGVLDSVAKYDADFIAMATHGRAGLSRQVMGNIMEGVLRRATSPLLILKSTALVNVRSLDAVKSSGRPS